MKSLKDRMEKGTIPDAKVSISLDDFLMLLEVQEAYEKEKERLEKQSLPDDFRRYMAYLNSLLVEIHQNHNLMPYIVRFNTEHNDCRISADRNGFIFREHYDPENPSL